ncbi:MAG: signal recognition particle protein [Victivallaceae bacterium]|nr:signal recognition particle protein [Victivallaceae bacterium]
MLDALSDKLHDVFKRLRGEARLTESNIDEAMRDIRLALLDADVNLEVVREFITGVKADCLGQEVLRSVTPGQQLVKIVNDRLTELLGSEASELDLSGKPTVIMLVGLHGSGKTTTAAKLAKLLKKSKKSVLLAACDVYRPAAIDQLEFLGRELGVGVYSDRGNADVASIAAAAIDRAKFEHTDVVILDTAGRLQIDQPMIQELVRLRQSVRADELLLVADAALGQEAVAVAGEFNRALGLTGFILTKLDGDARGGAALSIRKVTGCPVKFIGTGEKLDDLEQFHPERMASRILGMGDVVSLVERAASEIDEKEAKLLHDKMKRNAFDFNDFLSQMKQLSKLGGMEGILKMLPGGRQLEQAASAVDQRQMNRIEAMILSMTPFERENPDDIDFSRRKRIARGSGVAVEQVSGLVKQFTMMRKMMKKTNMLSRMFGGGGMAMPDGGAMPGAMPGAFPGMGGAAGASGKDKEKRKKLAKLAKKQRRKNR